MREPQIEPTLIQSSRVPNLRSLPLISLMAGRKKSFFCRCHDFFSLVSFHFQKGEPATIYQKSHQPTEVYFVGQREWVLFYDEKKNHFLVPFSRLSLRLKKLFASSLLKEKRTPVGKCNRWLFLLEKNGGTENSH